MFAANSRFRSEVTPARRGRQGKPEQVPAERRRAMGWGRRRKRVFRIDGEVCKHCGGRVRVVACIDDQPTIGRRLDHLDKKGGWVTPMSLLPEGRGPPGAGAYF
ncbi:MAG: hypothetical protein GY814_12425 [Gammaproteobacteria bacterium]|nr:hypothetical protein [Gammaproteobacteria bacterium]